MTKKITHLLSRTFRVQIQILPNIPMWLPPSEIYFNFLWPIYKTLKNNITRCRYWKSTVCRGIVWKLVASDRNSRKNIFYSHQNSCRLQTTSFVGHIMRLICLRAITVFATIDINRMMSASERQSLRGYAKRLRCNEISGRGIF